MYTLHGAMNYSLLAEAVGDKLSCQDCTSAASVGSSAPAMRAMPGSSSTGTALRSALLSAGLGCPLPCYPGSQSRENRINYQANTVGNEQCPSMGRMQKSAKWCVGEPGNLTVLKIFSIRCCTKSFFVRSSCQVTRRSLVNENLIIKLCQNEYWY